ncbi:MAG: twin-arginine translocase TatA/TatE family subunit [Sphingomonadales bacterium]
MGLPGWGQILLVVLLIVLLFGRGKISDLMGDVAKGIRSFKDGLKDDPEAIEDPGEKPEAIAQSTTTEETIDRQKEEAS